MRNLFKILSLTLLMLVVLIFFACDFDESKNHLSGGVLLDDEMISEIKNEVLSSATEKETEEKSTDATTTPEKETKVENNGVVYWTESGSVWHESATCSHLKNSSKILSGSAADAQNAGKSKACSRCSD